MKRNLLALAIPALLVAGTANASIEVWNKDSNKLNINGRVKAANYLSVGKSDDARVEEGDKTEARLGFTGETQISDNLTGYGRAEWNYKTASGSTEVRYAFAGLNFGQAGSIDYGKNDGVLKAITAYTDVLPEFGGDSTNYIVLGKRTDAVLTYRNAALVDGLSFAVQYADSDDRSAGITPATREAYGVNAQYTILDTGLTIGAGYAEKTKENAEKSYIVGVNYDANNLYVAAIYNHTKNRGNVNGVKVNGFEAVVQYGIDFEAGRLTPSLAYVQHKSKVSGSSTSLVKYVEVGAKYDFNKNLTAIVDYKINQIKHTRDTVGLGLIYQF